MASNNDIATSNAKKKPKPEHHHPDHKDHHEHEVDVWSVEGQFQHVIYSPKGAIEGFIIHTDDTPTQFVIDSQDSSVTEQIAKLRKNQILVVEGIAAAPSPKGEAEHTVYQFERIASIAGRPVPPVHTPQKVKGTVVRFNHAKHGERNGLVLDTGDFIHTKPDGLAGLHIEIGDMVEAEGDAKRLAGRDGYVIEARTLNGKPVGPKH